MITNVVNFITVPQIAHRRQYWILAVCFGTGLALFTSLSTLLQQILCPRGYSDVGGAIVFHSRVYIWCESLRKLCVAYNNIFRKLIHQARACSASHMFVSRQLPTCKMLILGEMCIHGFMLNVQKSNNLILNSSVHCDIMFTSPLWKHWRLLLYIHPF